VSRVTFQIEYDGVQYAATAQADLHGVYRIGDIWDRTHQEYLPIQEIESEYVRRRGSLEATILRSRWAARRRTRQYLRLWSELRETLGT